MAASPLCRVSEDELKSLAASIGPDRNQTIGAVLGFDSKTLNDMKKEYGNGAVLRILIQWMEQQSEAADVRGRLAEKLKEIGLETEGNILLHELAQGTFSTFGLDDKLLVDLADDIETEEHVDTLGLELGFKQAALYRYRATSRQEGRVTSKGTQNMLFDWRQKTEPAKQRSELALALRRSQLVKLATEYVPGSPKGDSAAQICMPSLSDRPLADIPLDQINITDNFTAEQCRQRLIHLYKTTLCKVQIKPWDKNSVADVKDIFTVVTMYKKDADGSNLGEQEKVTLQGSVDEIFKTEVNGELPYRIVVLAAAGKGKTTSVAKMAYDWVHQTKGSAFEHLPLLFTVKLRKANRYMSLAEAIISEYLRDIIDLTPELLQKFIKTHQKLCWVVLDGLDEYSGLGGNFSLESSVGSIVATLNFNDLQECRVLVTCRPHLESYFEQGQLPRIYAKMVIEGFGEEQSKEYIDRFFTDEVKSQRVKEYLSHHDVIKELVTTPLFCLMVCCLWADGRLEGINTQTQLFDGVNLFLWQHSKDRGEAVRKSELHEAMHDLGKVALRGLLKNSNKLIFSPKDFTKFQTALLNGKKLGIVSESVQSQQDSFSDQSESSSCIEFYHKSAQEHAAGKYLAKQSSKFLMKLKLSKLDFVLRKIRGHVGQYENILRFAGGSDGKTCTKVMQEILSNSSLAKSERFRLLFDCSTEAASLEGSVSSFVQGCIENGEVVLKSPTVYTIVGLKKLPQEFKQEITNVTIERPRLVPPLLGRINDGLKTLPQLQHLTISHPTKVHALPHVTTMSSLKLEGLPSTCDDWEWLQDADNLTELHVTLLASDDDAESEGPSLHLIDGKMTSTKMSQQTLKVFEHLPRRISMKIGSVELLNCKLTASLSERLSDGLQSLPQLDHVTVSQPSVIQSLPTLGSISSLKLQDFPESFFEGHGWLNGAGDAENLEVTFTVSGDVSGSRKERKSESSLHLTQGQITLSNAAKKTIMVVENLPQDISYKIHHLCLEHKHLTVDLTHRLWSCVAAFSSLVDLTIEHSSLTFSPRIPTLPSIRSLTVTDISADSYRGLVRSLPRLDWISPMESQRIHLDLSEDEGTLYRLELDGSDVAERRVSSETMRVLCEAVRGITSLRDVWLLNLVIDEEDLIRLMEACRTVRAIESIYLFNCGSQPRGRLEAHVERVRHPPGREDGIKVWIRHHGGSFYNAYVPHVQ